MSAFDARDLLDCYARGVFPMADAREDARVFLIDPERRGVIPLGGFHVPKRLARTVRADRFEVRVDTAFHEVVLACAASGPGRTETWINRPIERLYLRLHEIGHGHSVECWQDGRLVGGLYGVSLRGAFFGESMFSRARDASKVALVHLVARLIAGGFRLLDAQFMTEHLGQFGAEEIGRLDYHRRLAAALEAEGRFYVGGAPGSTLMAGGSAALGVGDTAGGGVAGDGVADEGAVLTGGTALAGGSSSSLGSSLGGALAGGGRAADAVVVGAGALALQLIAQAS
jgi:leucyl/phenylalanyl-tRNA--protein transferase